MERTPVHVAAQNRAARFGGKKGGENIISRVELDKVRFEDVRTCVRDYAIEL